MNRRGFLRGVLSVAAGSVAAKVAPKRPVAEPVMGVGRGSLLVMDNLGMHVNCRCAELPCEVVDTDAVLPLYIDDNGDLREASGRLARYMALDNEGIDTRPMRDASEWTTPEARRLVESINSYYSRSAEMLPYLTGFTKSGEQSIRDYAAAWRVT